MPSKFSSDAVFSRLQILTSAVRVEAGRDPEFFQTLLEANLVAKEVPELKPDSSLHVRSGEIDDSPTNGNVLHGGRDRSPQRRAPKQSDSSDLVTGTVPGGFLAGPWLRLHCLLSSGF